MTAVNVFVKRDRAFMLTDAAIYDAEGSIVGFGQKAFTLPTLPAVIACRGLIAGTLTIAADLALYRDFDHVLERFEKDMHDWFYDNMVALSIAGHQEIQVFLVGYSEKQGKCVGVYFDSTQDQEQVAIIDEDATAPDPFYHPPQQAELNFIGQLPGVNYEARTFDPIRNGIPLMEAQRRVMAHMHNDPANPLISLVGGHILLTEVSRQGITQKIIHRWNDKAGVPIAPEPFEKTMWPYLSGKQRREAQRALAGNHNR